MNYEEQVEFQINSSAWWKSEADKAIAEYKACKTQDAKARLLPKLKDLHDRLNFECREIKKLMVEE